MNKRRRYKAKRRRSDRRMRRFLDNWRIDKSVKAIEARRIANYYRTRAAEWDQLAPLAPWSLQ